MLKTISISELKPGMYITEIIAGTGNAMPKKKQGMVRDPRIIKKFIEIGIAKLVINTEKGIDLIAASDKPKPGFQDEAIDQSFKNLGQKNSVNYQALNLEWGTAKEIFATTSNIINKSLDAVRDHEDINVEYFGQACDAITRSLQRNQDALTWLGRLRHERSYLFEHSVNCSVLMGIFARSIGMSHMDIEHCVMGALMADLGQAHIDESIFYKEGPLDEAEFNEVKLHVAHGAEMIEKYPGELPRIVCDIIKYQHERWNGKGYPNGLSGDEIPLEARMFAIIDTYDAITTKRCHRDATPSTKCMRTLLELAGEEFDQTLVHKFIKCMGVYPTSSLVKLDDGMLAVVVEQHPDDPLKPLVKVIYNAKQDAYTKPHLLNLSNTEVTQKIDSYEDPAKYKINIDEFMPSEDDF